jgi:hypothetical protein
LTTYDQRLNELRIAREKAIADIRNKKLSENSQARAKRLAIRRDIATKMNASLVSVSLS